MGALDEIQAAITKLEESKPSLHVCSEFNYEAVRHMARNVDLGHDCGDDECGWERYNTGPAFDMLIRTIDAQLAILRHVAAHYSGDLGIGINRHAVALARAINGAVS